MDPPAESGQAPASDKTCASFSDKTTGTFGDQTTPSFSDQTSVTPLMLSRAKIVLWGDSLTQLAFEGWGARLADRYQRRADVVNRGMSGYNTAWFLHLPDESVPNVVLCTIWFGANDASLPDLNPHHYVSLENYQANLKALVHKANSLLHQPNLLLITPPPVDHPQRFAYQKQRYGPLATGILERTLENSGKYAAACQQVADELRVPCLNLWDKFQTVADWPKFLVDGLHFSKEGHDFFFSCLMEAIETHFPDLVVTPCPVTGQVCNSGSRAGAPLPAFGPYHDRIDSKDPAVAMKQAFKDLAVAAAAAPSTPGTKKPKMDAP